MTEWECDCGNFVVTQGTDPPMPMSWSDGHRCRFHVVKPNVLDRQASGQTTVTVPKIVEIETPLDYLRNHHPMYKNLIGLQDEWIENARHLVHFACFECGWSSNQMFAEHPEMYCVKCRGRIDTACESCGEY